MSRIILCTVFLVSQWGVSTCNNDTRSHTVDVSRKCPDVLHRVDYVDEFRVTGMVDYNNSKNAWWKRYKRCRVTFETTQDMGLCIDMKTIDFAEDITLDFLTTAYRPEKHYGKGLSSEFHWCTHRNQITMVLKLPRGEMFLPLSAFNFVFHIKNVSLDRIEKVYNMGSPANCDMHYILEPKETAIIRSDVVPPPDPAPEVCQMTFTSLSEEEYGQVCVWIETFTSHPQCDMELDLKGLDTNYWTEDLKYDCETNLNETEEVCSGDRVLTLRLKREKHINSASFQLKIASKWMPFWESAESMKTEMSWLKAAKSLTVLIATMDTIIVLTAAFISVGARYPYGRLKVIGDMFGKDPTVPHHYGNEYPVAVAVASGESDPPPF